MTPETQLAVSTPPLGRIIGICEHVASVTNSPVILENFRAAQPILKAE